MKCVTLLLLFLSGFAHAQVSSSFIRRDSVPSVFPPDVMPNARSNNSFYRYHSDPNNVVRATLDNMPVKVPDTSTYYSALRPYRHFQQHFRKEDLPPLIKPMPNILPRRFRK
ncbi:hypothetical protein IC229_07305 [Spirosoma sp. BT702]|uniref:Uncharacterized protein n=1 Tax=Spirosoma profusum TaxID=2771354 RepID=A0A926XV69_9BACT|nr:hypothetical protein [Spirosoma profusum]MBD2700435.1 hypothetical protein [Spirosoma profusum]